MVNLVTASFVVALTPVALDLAWRLVSSIGDWIGRGFARAARTQEPCGTYTPEPFSMDRAPRAIARKRAAQSWV